MDQSGGKLYTDCLSKVLAGHDGTASGYPRADGVLIVNDKLTDHPR